mgnify:CR=1 FL=1
MYTSIERQRGLGWFGMLLVFGVIGFLAVVVVKVGPLYMNHGTVLRVVKGVADNPDFANADAGEIKKTLERRWDIDYINQIDDKDIKIKRTAKGRVLAYDYEARVNLFYNVFVVVHFKDEHPMKPGAGSVDGG